MKFTKVLQALLGCSLLSMFVLINAADAARVRVYRTPVVIHKGHVHSVRCGHYFYGKNWYFIKGHVHARHCGHALVNGIWIVRN